MAAIESDFDLLNLPHRPDDDVSSEPKSPPPPKPEWWLLDSDSDTASDSDGERHRLRGQKPCCECITAYEPPEYKPTVKIGSFHVPDYMEAFVEKMIGSYLDNTNSVLVTDLSFDVVSNSDLAELCRPYGNVTSADVAIDQESGLTWFFGFVSFATRDDAQNAINNLDGVQWLTPKTTS